MNFLPSLSLYDEALSLSLFPLGSQLSANGGGSLAGKRIDRKKNGRKVLIYLREEEK